MGVNIQVRDVPSDVHKRLKVRAAEAGMTLSEFLLRELTEVARRPTIEQLVERIRGRGPTQVRLDSARAVRAEREARR
ncbi:MAG: hypothetical protein HYZ29_10370 [Myxococcales bacterium]|nr:hypothetical protein [Myxococcales bacterium]